MEGFDRLTAIILAAGYSSRMGESKPLLEIEGKTVIERVVDTFRKAGIHDVRVVVGYEIQKLVPLLEKLGVSILHNKEFDKGMFSSVQTGVKGLVEEDKQGFFLTPADFVLIDAETITQLAEAYLLQDWQIIYPCFCGKRGHPPIISTELAEAILSYDGHGGLRALLLKYEERALNLAVSDEFILLDMDTKEEYKQVLRLVEGNKSPT